MNKFYIVIYILSSFFFSCETKNEEKNQMTGDPEKLNQAMTLNTDIKRRDSLVESAIKSGDEKAYNEAASAYFIEDMYEEFLFVSMTVANKYDNPEAYYHTYEILYNENSSRKVDSIDTRTKQLALFYLMKSYEKGYSKAKSKVEDLFGVKSNMPNSKYYLSELLKLEEK